MTWPPQTKYAIAWVFYWLAAHIRGHLRSRPRLLYPSVGQIRRDCGRSDLALCALCIWGDPGLCMAVPRTSENITSGAPSASVRPLRTATPHVADMHLELVGASG
jgi:hypothetical protein